MTEARVIVGTKISDAKQKIADAQDILMEAAAVCKGDAMEDRINSIYDGLEDLRFNLGHDLREWLSCDGEAS